MGMVNPSFEDILKNAWLKMEAFLTTTGMILATNGDGKFYVIEPQHYGDYDMYRDLLADSAFKAMIKAYDGLPSGKQHDVWFLFNRIDQQCNGR